MSCVEEFGIYDNMKILAMPDHMLLKNGGYYYSKDTVSIDPCIVEEIEMLWRNGVRTINSCCGHGKLRASVIVENSSEQTMIELGYEVNNSWHEGFDCDIFSKEWMLKSRHVS